jgi:hypothetical protein
MSAIVLSGGKILGGGGAVFLYDASNSINPIGINLNAISYFSNEYPFNNMFKQMSASNSINGWLTQTSGNVNTNEEGWLVCDSDGYVTSLVAGNGFGGSQVFTEVGTFLVISSQTSGLAPGQTYYYPIGVSGTYTFQFQGAGTLVFGNDVTACSTSTPNVSCVGTTITSTMSAGNTATVTVSVTPTSSGIKFNITAIPNSLNYPKAFSLVQTENQAAYLAGELFTPIFKAGLTNSGAGGYSRIRFMDWLQTNTVDWVVNFTGTVSGTSGGTLSSMTSTGLTYTTWPLVSGTYNFLFKTGQTIACNCTYGSAAVTWSTALSASIPTSGNGQAFFSPIQSFTQRPLMSNCSWGTYGVPLEACIQLCNEVGCDAWINIPGTVQGMTNYATSVAQLLYNGTGANISGTPLSSFNGLNSGQKAYIEYMNEYWNSEFSQYNLTVMMGSYLYAGNYPYWFGSQLAGIGDTFYTTYGSAAFAARVVISASRQAGSTNGYELQQYMNSTAGTTGGTAVYLHHIGQIHTGGYFGLDKISAGDWTQMQTLSVANQVNAYFALAYGNVYNGYTYSSMPSNGFIGQAVTQIGAEITYDAGYAWSTLPRAVYEGGSANNDYVGNQAAWNTWLVQAHRDTRTQYLYYDAAHVLDATGNGYFTRMAAAAVAGGTTIKINIFADQNAPIANQDYGTLESYMQTISPLSSAPPKYQGIMNYVAA